MNLLLKRFNLHLWNNLLLPIGYNGLLCCIGYCSRCLRFSDWRRWFLICDLKLIGEVLGEDLSLEERYVDVHTLIHLLGSSIGLIKIRVLLLLREGHSNPLEHSHHKVLLHRSSEHTLPI